MTTSTEQHSGILPRPALIVLLAGVVSGLHIGKVAPALPTLQAALGLTLVQAGFLISLVQVAGVAIGLAVGLTVGGLGLRRSVVSGLLIMTAASILGAGAQSASLLLSLRALEGLGFLLAVMPGPSLLRQSVADGRLSFALGLWSSYMPTGQGLAMLVGPWAIAAAGWRAWWWLLGLASAAVALWAWRELPPDPARTMGKRKIATSETWRARLVTTLRAPGPWLVSLSFAAYTGPWLGVVGFLPSIYSAAGITAGVAGAMTALVVISNIGGNVAAGRLLVLGARPRILLWTGFTVMGLTAVVTFADFLAAPPLVRYLAVILFSAVGGLVPSTLFTLAVRLAPSEKTVSTTVGWMQQWSSLSQLAVPPLIGAAAAAAGGWHWTWAITGTCSLLGIALALGLAHELQRTGQRT